MAQAQVHQHALFSGGKYGQYLGVETALSFAGPLQELEALRSGCAVFDLNWRALVSATGKDRVRWLHNMVTNNVRDLLLNRGNYNFVLNAQGRILGDLYVFNRGESFLIETDRMQVEGLLAALRRFIIMDKVELTKLGSNVTAIGVAGPGAMNAIAALGIESGNLEPLHVQDCQYGNIALQIIRGPQQKPHWFEIWVDASLAETIARALVEAGAQPLGADILEIWRVLRGIPQYGKDIRDRDLPHETGQMQALNFNKGCYIGQEIVERIRSRGQVHRRFTGFEFEDKVPAIGKFESDGRTFAEVTSTARVPGVTGSAGPRNIGLGYVRNEAVPASGLVELSGARAKLVTLPFEANGVKFM